LIWKLRRRKKRKRERIEKEDFKAFLEKVEKAVNSLYGETKDLKKVQSEIANEVNKWLNSLEDLESDSFKAGVCFGVYSLVKVLNQEQKERGYYIA